MGKGLRDLEKLINNTMDGIASLHGQSVRGEIQAPGVNLGKNKKDAYVKYAADQYLKRQPITDIPEDIKITDKDIIRELVIRKIKSVIKV